MKKLAIVTALAMLLSVGFAQDKKVEKKEAKAKQVEVKKADKKDCAAKDNCSTADKKSCCDKETKKEVKK